MENQNHTHVFEHIVVPATCQSKGYTLHRCNCGYEYTDSFTPATENHSFEVISQTEPTCTQPGHVLGRCTVCGVTKEREIPAQGHSWGDWNVTTMPSCTEEGHQQRICTRCGAMDEQTIPARGHNFTSRKKSATEKGVTECFCGNCGQTILVKSAFKKNKKKIIAWVSVLAVLALIITLVPVFFGSFCHYTAGKVLTALGMYEQAYYQFKECEDYKDTEELLKDFRLICGETIHTDSDGDSYTSEEEEYDPDTNEITSIKYYSDGTVRYREARCYDGNGNEIQYNYDRYESDGKLERSSKFKYEYDDEGNRVRYIAYDSNGKKTDETKHTYDADGNCTHTVCYDGNGKKTGETRYTYDNDGNCIKSVTYNSKGEKTGEEEYTYDEDGNETSYSCWYINVSGEKVSYTYKYKYDKDGNRTKETHYDHEGVKTQEEVWTYDKDGNRTSYSYWNITDSGKETSYTYKYKYDKDNNLTQEIRYNSDGEVEFEYKYKYDKDGNCTQEIAYDSDGKVSREHKYKYDKDGNRTQVTRYNKAGEVEFEHKFKYDEHGNCTQETRYDSDGEVDHEYKYKDYEVIYLAVDPD